MTSVLPKTIAAELNELWSPRVIAEVDDAYIKVAKVKGVLAWHSHENEDELFLILKGTLQIEMEDRTVELTKVSSSSCRRVSVTLRSPPRNVTSC